MKKGKTTRIQDLIGLVNSLYPPFLAEKWDNVGIQAGDPTSEVSKVLVCLDPSEKALDTAEAQGIQAILSHHPLIFNPLKNITPTDETGRILHRSIQAKIAILCAHTNLDRATGGLNDWLAERLGLLHPLPLLSGENELLKLVVYVPADYEEKVAEALFKAGAGKIGNYDCCSFRSKGTGTFRPGSGTRPFSGTIGQTEYAPEVRLETIIPRGLQSRVISRMIKAHPYEEVAYDLIPLANHRPDTGLGRIGILSVPSTLEAFATEVKKALHTSSLRIVGDSARKISKVALCGGSGASLLPEAFRQGADVLLTGDIKYHEAKNAENMGIALIDAGHFATEHIMVHHMAAALRKEAKEQDIKIEFLEMEGEQDPFRII